MNYVLDTNIVDGLIEDDENLKKIMQEKFLEGEKILIHCIAYYERKRGLLVLKDKDMLRKFESIVNRFELFFLDEVDFFDRAAEIWKNLHPRSKEVGDADILIGAGAKEKGFIVVTNNEKDFKRIPGVQFENWLKH
jgi:tRNA(fMet)-specific endonuclease VapC